MKTLSTLVATTALAFSVGTAAFAQDTVTGVRALDDQIEDVSYDARREIARQQDSERFGPNDVAQGMRGSAALTSSGTWGNTDTGDLAFAGRLTFGTGSWTHLWGFGGEYSQENNVDSEKSAFAIYEGARYFTPQFYAFGTGRYQYDGIGTYKNDAFLGLGLGYRIVNTPDFTWRVQAGPGVRYLKDRLGNSETDFAGIASSRVYYGFTNTVSMTNDTDILGSDTNTTVVNDFGINYKMNDTLSTRLSYRIDYDTDPLPGDKSTENKVGISLVVGF